MFDKKYEDRLRIWSDFRNSLENSRDPIQETIDFYSKAPLVNIVVDPYDKDTWLDPWQMIYENTYCNFSIILSIAYTLKLTERFSQSNFEIHICTDNSKSEVKYLLCVEDSVVGYRIDKAVKRADLPKELIFETKYSI